jgi:hypothetical protein
MRVTECMYCTTAVRLTNSYRCDRGETGPSNEISPSALSLHRRTMREVPGCWSYLVTQACQAKLFRPLASLHEGLSQLPSA